MVQFLSINFFLGFLQFLLGFSKVPVFLCHPVLTLHRYHSWIYASQFSCQDFWVVLAGPHKNLYHDACFKYVKVCCRLSDTTFGPHLDRFVFSVVYYIKISSEIFGTWTFPVWRSTCHRIIRHCLRMLRNQSRKWRSNLDSKYNTAPNSWARKAGAIFCYTGCSTTSDLFPYLKLTDNKITVFKRKYRPATSWGVHYTTTCNTQSSAPEDG